MIPPQPHPPSRTAWQLFRFRIIDALDRVDRATNHYIDEHDWLDRRRFHYLDEDRMVHVCPVCQCRDGWLSVRFVGKTSRADIHCSQGCSDDEIASALELKEASHDGI